MIDKYQILLESLYYETVVNKDFEKYKELVWDNDETKVTVEYYKDGIYKMATHFKDKRGHSPLVRYFNSYDSKFQNLHLHRLDGPAYNQGNLVDYYIDGKHLSYLDFLAQTKFKPEDKETGLDLLNI
jgi:hypothetical protein